MKHTKFISLVLVSILVVMLVMATAGPSAAQNPTPAATESAFDIKAAVQDYLTKLPADFYGIKPADVLQAMSTDPKPYLVDIRDAKDFGDGGFVAGAVNIPLPALTQSLDKLPAKDQAIIVYCGIGHRGGIALMTLRMLGYTNVKSMFGGFTAWKNAKLPVATGTPPAATSFGKSPEVNPDLFAMLDKFVTSLPAGYLGIPPADALKASQTDPKPVFVDVREAAELTNNGYIDGAINIPIRTIFDNLDKLPKDLNAPMIVYCAIGHRGSMAMVALRLLGYTNVKSISGGFNNWVSLGLPIVKPAATPAATAAK